MARLGKDSDTDGMPEALYFDKSPLAKSQKPQTHPQNPRSLSVLSSENPPLFEFIPFYLEFRDPYFKFKDVHFEFRDPYFEFAKSQTQGKPNI